MNKIHHFQEQIDNYLFGLLSEEELKAFEQRLTEDAKLRNEVELTRQIMENFRKKGEQNAQKEVHRISSTDEIRQIFQSAERKYKSRTNRNVKRLSIYISSATAIILILIFIGMQPKYDSQQLFHDYYKPDEYIPTASRGGDSEFEKKQAQKLYDAICMVNTEQTIVAIDSLIQFSSVTVSGGEVSATTGTAISAWGENSTVTVSGGLVSAPKEDAQWNLALAYLKINKRDRAEKILREIAINDGSYRYKAQELSEKINRKKWF